VVEPGQPVPKGGGVYRVGKPYEVGGRLYTPEENSRYRAEGLASWYGDDFHGRLTANGEIYDMSAISAAHPTLPMPSYVRVTNLANRKSLIVRVNDRGPYHRNREIDVSAKAAELLGFRHSGTARVRVEYVGLAPLEGTDDRQLAATLRDGQPAPAPVIMTASNKFLPNFGRPPTIRGGAPLPQERPFDLGEGADRIADNYPRQSAEMTRLASEALARHPVNPRYVDISPDTEPPRAMAARLRAQEARDIRAAEMSANRVGGPWVQPAPAPTPVSAYAPVRQDGALAVASGRGLY
jgi:rare lipoprotein A